MELLLAFQIYVVLNVFLLMIDILRFYFSLIICSFFYNTDFVSADWFTIITFSGKLIGIGSNPRDISCGGV